LLGGEAGRIEVVPTTNAHDGHDNNKAKSAIHSREPCHIPRGRDAGNRQLYGGFTLPCHTARFQGTHGCQMPLSVGIVGLPNVGTTTVLNALTVEEYAVHDGIAAKSGSKASELDIAFVERK
jgi:predicted GTPase